MFWKYQHFEARTNFLCPFVIVRIGIHTNEKVKIMVENRFVHFSDISKYKQGNLNLYVHLICKVCLLSVESNFNIIYIYLSIPKIGKVSVRQPIAHLSGHCTRDKRQLDKRIHFTDVRWGEGHRCVSHIKIPGKRSLEKQKSSFNIGGLINYNFSFKT